MTKVKPIKASLSFKKESAGDVVARANAVLGGVFLAKDDYVTPPIAQAAFQSQIDALSAAMAAALDGAKKAIAAREHAKEAVITFQVRAITDAGYTDWSESISKICT